MNRPGTSPADEALLVAYVDGELGLAESMEFEQRLASEPELENALRAFLAAEDLSQQLGQRRVQPVGPRVARSPRRTATMLGIALAVAAALLAAWPFLGAGPGVAFDLTDVVRASTRGGDPDGVEFRVRVRCTEPRFVLLLTISPTGKQVSVAQRHPIPAGPLLPRDADWPTDPFGAGSEVSIPPAGKYPMQVAEGGLVVVCSRSDRAFEAAEIELVKRDVGAAHAAWLAAGDGGHGPMSCCQRVVAAVRTASRVGWSVECRPVTAR